MRSKLNQINIGDGMTEGQFSEHLWEESVKTTMTEDKFRTIYAALVSFDKIELQRQASIWGWTNKDIYFVKTHKQCACGAFIDQYNNCCEACKNSIAASKIVY